jgi:hypothetical protein
MSYGEGFGGGQPDPRDFVERYRQGSPHEGYTEREAMERYRDAAAGPPPDGYEEAAREAFERMSPAERVEFGRYLQGRTRSAGVGERFPDFNQDGIDDRLQDPRYLAGVAGRMRREEPGMFDRLVGGEGQGSGGVLGHPLAKVALGGMAAYGLARAVGDVGGMVGRGLPFGGDDRERYEERDRRPRALRP